MYHQRINLLLVLCFVLLVGCGTPAKIVETNNPEPQQFEAFSESTYPLQFRKIVVNVDRGEHIGAIQGGLACISKGNLNWRGGRMTLDPREFDQVFRDEAAKINLDIVGDPDALFEDPDTWRAEYLAAGQITELKANVCYPYDGFNNYTSSKAEAFMSVEWQIYSRLDREVVSKIETQGSSKVTDAQDGGDTLAMLNAFSDATQGLFANPEFRNIIKRSSSENRNEDIGKLDTKISFDIVPPVDTPIDLESIRQEVVTIYAGDGHGSGFVITKDGYVMTNSHVVENASRVLIKGSNDKETVAEVIASDRKRDIALIKTDADWLKPIPIRLDNVQIGEEVYAIGSPYLSELDSSVTKGIVSGHRIDRGYPLIQSDAAINPGNSGGPLLDKNGNIVGIAVSSLRSGGGQTGINFFIPIQDALDQLNAAYE